MNGDFLDKYLRSYDEKSFRWVELVDINKLIEYRELFDEFIPIHKEYIKKMKIKIDFMKLIGLNF